ncbi:MAG: hypothetical protein AAF443_02300, partial [Chlamydiota bacterium]
MPKMPRAFRNFQREKAALFSYTSNGEKEVLTKNDVTPASLQAFGNDLQALLEQDTGYHEALAVSLAENLGVV